MGGRGKGLESVAMHGKGEREGREGNALNVQLEEGPASMDSPVAKTAPSLAGPVSSRGPHSPTGRAWVATG